MRRPREAGGSAVCRPIIWGCEGGGGRAAGALTDRVNVERRPFRQRRSLRQMARIRVDLRVPVGRPLPDVAAFIARCEEAGFDGVGIHDHPSSGRDAYLALALAWRRSACGYSPRPQAPWFGIRSYSLRLPTAWRR